MKIRREQQSPAVIYLKFSARFLLLIQLLEVDRNFVQNIEILGAADFTTSFSSVLAKWLSVVTFVT